VERIRIGGIIQKTQLTKLDVLSAPDRPGVAAALLKALGAARINVQFIVQCIDAEERDHIVLCVDADDARAALSIAERIRLEIQASHVRMLPDVALLAIFGPDFRERPGIAGTMFDALAREGINILAISTSISTVCCVIRLSDLDKACSALRQTFELP
jgi:aspartate kinase